MTYGSMSTVLIGTMMGRNSLPVLVPSLISYLSCLTIEPQAKHGMLCVAVKNKPMYL